MAKRRTSLAELLFPLLVLAAAAFPATVGKAVGICLVGIVLSAVAARGLELLLGGVRTLLGGEPPPALPDRPSLRWFTGRSRPSGGGFAALAAAERRVRGPARPAPGTILEADDEPAIRFLGTSASPGSPAAAEPAGPEEVLLLEVASRPPPDATATCPYCGDELAPAAAVRCTRCGTPHHEDCWKASGACTTYGCRGRAARRG